MSQSTIEKFIEDVSENKELQDKLKTMGNDVEKITQFVNSKGYDFKASDLESFTDKKIAELSDENLDKISGGVVPSSREGHFEESEMY